MNDINEILRKGETALAKNKFDKAIKKYISYLELNANESNVWNDLAFAYNKKGLYSKAIESCLQSLKLNPHSSNPKNNLFFAYDQKEDFEAALEILEKYIQIHSISYDFPFKKPNSFIFYGDHQFTMSIDEKYFKKYKKLTAPNREIIIRQYIIDSLPSLDFNHIIPLNFCYRFQFSKIIDSNHKIDVLKLILKVFPKNYRVMSNIGLAYSEQEKYENAIEYYQPSLEINPNIPNTWIDLGISFYFIGQYEKAINSFQHAIEIDPKSKMAYIYLGRIYLKEKNFIKARDTLEYALNLQPNIERLKNVFISLFPAAKDYPFRAEENIKSIEFAWYYLAKSYYMNQEYKKATEACNKSLKIKPKFDKALKLKHRILAL